jgi:hypothetical protein
MHALRHAHASWLLAGGADLQVVKERLGHDSIATTERYLHTLPDADDTAVEQPQNTELANLCPDILDDADTAAHTGLHRIGSSYQLCFNFLDHTGLQL